MQSPTRRRAKRANLTPSPPLYESIAAARADAARLGVARRVHRLKSVRTVCDSLLLPKPWRGSAYRVVSECRPAEDVAGDFFVVSALGPRRLNIVIGDACGRGRSAHALLPQLLPQARELSRQGVPPARLLSELNRTAVIALAPDRFVTAAALDLDAERGTLTISNAGHVPALVRTPHAGVIIVGRASGPPLGVIANVEFVEETARLHTGDTVLLLTDGVLEPIENDLLEMSRLKEILAASSSDGGAVRRAVFDAFDRSLASKSVDDASLLGIEVLDATVGTGPSLAGSSLQCAS